MKAFQKYCPAAAVTADREKADKGIVWCNRFRATLAWDVYLGRVVTRYSSQLLFGM